MSRVAKAAMRLAPATRRLQIPTQEQDRPALICGAEKKTNKESARLGTEDSKGSLPFRGRYRHQGLHGDHLELSRSRAVVCLAQIME